MAGIELRESHMERMGIPKRFWGADIERVPKSIRERVKKVCTHISSFLDNGYGLILFGANGVGKTAASVCVCKAARQTGHSVLFIHAEDLRQASMSSMRDDGLVQRARSVDLLVIDDLGKEYRSESGFVERMFETLIRHRSSSMKSTIITTNMTKEKLASVYKHSMLSVLKECTYPMHVTGDDRRLESGREIGKWIDSL